MVWFVIPFSMLISWVYTSLDQVGENMANPFEGNANDVPISRMSRGVETDIREMLAEVDLPPALPPQNNIVLQAGRAGTISGQVSIRMPALFIRTRFKDSRIPLTATLHNRSLQRALWAEA